MNIISSSKDNDKMLTNAKVEYTCKNGLVVLPGSSSINTCDHNGNWSSTEAPKCVKGLKKLSFVSI